MLATALLAGEPTMEGAIARGRRAFGRKWAWLRPLASRYLKIFNGPTRPRHREVVQFLLRNKGFQKACAKHSPELQVEQWIAEPDRRRLREARDLYSRPHVPQGACTSPALANLRFYRADGRLTGLAKSAEAAYTRYADDLAFSGGGELERRAERFSIHAPAIVMEEGFRVHHRKTRVMRQT